MGEKKKKSVVMTAVSLPFKIWKLIKLIILFVVLGSIIIGYSGYKTVQGFREGQVTQSDYLYVDTVNNTANFTLTVGNDGFLPIKIDLDLKLDMEIVLDTQGGREVRVFYKASKTFNVGGGDSVSKNIVFENFTDEGLWLEDRMAFLDEIGHPQVGMILDIGHVKEQRWCKSDDYSGRADPGAPNVRQTLTAHSPAWIQGWCGPFPTLG